MNVYAVLDYGDLKAIFQTKEKAQEYIDAKIAESMKTYGSVPLLHGIEQDLRDCYIIEEYELQ